MAQKKTDKKSTAADIYLKSRGTAPSEGMQKFAECDPAFFQKFIEWSSHPRQTGVLSPKMRELIFIAIDASVTHLYAPGLRVHIQNALRMGVTKEEIMEVIQLVCALGIHAYTVAAPILLEETKVFQKEKKRKSGK